MSAADPLAKKKSTRKGWRMFSHERDDLSEGAAELGTCMSDTCSTGARDPISAHLFTVAFGLQAKSGGGFRRSSQKTDLYRSLGLAVEVQGLKDRFVLSEVSNDAANR